MATPTIETVKPDDDPQIVICSDLIRYLFSSEQEDECPPAQQR